MNRRLYSLVRLSRSCAAVSLAGSLIAVAPSAPATRDATASGEAHHVPVEGAAEIALPERTCYAVLLHGPFGLRRLYTEGDILLHPRDPALATIVTTRVERVDFKGVVLRDTGSNKRHLVRPGHRIPGFPSMLLLRTVILDRLHYRFKAVERVTQIDPVLLSISGSQAVLEKEVPRLFQPPLSEEIRRVRAKTGLRTLDPEAFRKIRATQVDVHTYELDQATVVPLLNNVLQVLSDLDTRIMPSFSVQTGMSVRVTSKVGEGILSPQGFTVKRAGLARTFGIEVGDTVLSINDRPVNNYLNTWWIFQELFIRERNLKELRVTIAGDGELMTKTFKMR